jgi:hypothetical protein
LTQEPTRVFNSRDASKVDARQTVTVQSGRTGATAVVANITSVQAEGDGQFVTAWASGSRPDTSVLKSSTGQTIANPIIVPVAADGTFRLYTFRRAHLIVDISGYFSEGTALPPGGLSATITGYTSRTSTTTYVIGTVSNGTPEEFRFVRVEVNCPGGELETDQVFLDAFETVGFSVGCEGIHTSGASVRGVIDL